MEKITCDNCQSENVYRNIQQCYVEYTFYPKEQKWSDVPVLINEPIDNKHLCEPCYEKWSGGELF